MEPQLSSNINNNSNSNITTKNNNNSLNLPSSPSLSQGKINNYVFKFIIIGDSGVGKSCIVHYYLSGKPKSNSVQTICVDFSSRNINYNDNTKVRLQIWDTAGQDKFRSVARSYYRGAIGLIIVYDITNTDSFSHLTSWLSEAKSTARSECSVIVVGNKNDLEKERAVSTEEGKKFSENNNLMFLEVSALNGNNIQNIFGKLTENIIKKVEKGIIDPETLVSNYAKELGKTILRQQDDMNTENNNYNCSQYYGC